MIRPVAIFSVGAVLLCVPAIPQDQDARIQINVNEVIVPVTVTDMKGRFVSNLEAKDFRVLDEGKPQKIEFFSHTQKQPIVVGFLLDMSNNTRIHWKKYQDSVMELVWNLLPGDPRYSGYLVSYGNSAELLVNTTTESDKIVDTIRKMKPGGGAALFDAIYEACTKRELVRGEPYEPRRVIVVVGDGHDNASGKTLDEVIEIAQRNLVTIYGMSTIAYGFDSPDRAVLERLAAETGGHVEYPLNTIFKDTAAGTYFCNPSDEGCYAYTVGTGGYEAAISKSIIGAVSAISGDVTTQYVLRYIPQADPDDKGKLYHRIKVEVDLPDVIIRARHGYYPGALAGNANGQ